MPGRKYEMQYRNALLAVAMIILVSVGGLPGRTARAEDPGGARRL